MRHFLATLVLALFALNAHAGLSKWVDADGKVHYSDTPPPDVAAQTVRDIAGKGTADAPASSVSKTYIEREAEWKKARQQKDDAAKKQAEQDKQAEAKKNNCAAARENARILEDSPRISTYDANGDRTIMDDASRTQNLENARKAIRENCN
ncbi:hypothetical protein MIZ01_1266 [Sideroxyarcus emersonii]|uniref:DUF4124 domain-containing protein n=1 Tax=Sideroxyarcus emersonii TaxID=2764705 RepID=A0AAN2BZ68_9PROT|nr:DUF4124 domain-containing protein [Sideroxyarcus emersonii]BCK87487.1 hypothetical protein MIZ01_1266 [Sideroxyarcus emersonii]